jgi:hypothetical protein
MVIFLAISLISALTRVVERVARGSSKHRYISEAAAACWL